ncbi:MAG: hypothetical protein PHP54_05620 [Clostridia bacterium]|nr:hypothetical protein [Clostridia bacterium]
MAENNSEERNASQELKIDDNLKEIMNKANKNRELTKDEIRKLEAEVKESLNFLEKIKEIKIPKDKYVVFTDGAQQLVYDNGEFFLEDTADSTKTKKKKKRSEAREMYIEYFIKNVLNKIAQKNALDTMVKSIAHEKEIGVKEEPEVKEKVKKEKTITPKKMEKEEKTNVKKENNNDLVR